MITASFDFSRINARMDRVKDAAKKAARPAAQAGAQVFYDEVRQRAPVSDKPHSTKGKKQTFQPGNLRDRIYQAYMREQSGDGSARYRISWNRKDAFYARFVEFGTSRMAAQPFLRPGYDAVRDAAVLAAKETMRERIKVGLS
ncbi:HK97-gp10 family putative phage morphogenesis protein [Paracidovorax wautersii]|uniref:HK97 gp10 family phage protein n=1 Tax=Paracidovorax wautersii TaxID=1177982 RepID=A0ABU1IHV4_9BURK|nr:HK97-gp10 family putative phage morphogenesis protein [Paracidovorax wautersii]MDR6216173.1 HK97 gp10 family phage protein [Paracidovorax wautersii]